MEIDKDHIQTQDETGELAPIIKLKSVSKLKWKTKRRSQKLVADDCDEKLAREGEQLMEEAERKFETKRRLMSEHEV